jgi:hypothetical protein
MRHQRSDLRERALSPRGMRSGSPTRPLRATRHAAERSTVPLRRGGSGLSRSGSRHSPATTHQTRVSASLDSHEMITISHCRISLKHVSGIRRSPADLISMRTSRISNKPDRCPYRLPALADHESGKRHARRSAHVVADRARRSDGGGRKDCAGERSRPRPGRAPRGRTLRSRKRWRRARARARMARRRRRCRLARDGDAANEERASPHAPGPTCTSRATIPRTRTPTWRGRSGASTTPPWRFSFPRFLATASRASRSTDRQRGSACPSRRPRRSTAAAAPPPQHRDGRSKGEAAAETSGRRFGEMGNVRCGNA